MAGKERKIKGSFKYFYPALKILQMMRIIGGSNPRTNLKLLIGLEFGN